ncbi:MAG: hypothetical protein A3A73_03405 [Omnitrophica bacterium RIFCSPLOWO2_01_FULL_50_24]|nr:MAG: hypothetical protein A3A73_03405 [Omnitrophica bacterium RIFCSPLOWO2_01_FULL_50_24]
MTGTLFFNVYCVFLFVCAVFGVHRLWLALIALTADRKDPVPVKKWRRLPHVTVQLPVYNERFVVERLIRSVCSLEYPKGLLEIQVLDDSTDDTTEMISKAITFFGRQGLDIRLIHRSERAGFKAGALAEGLKSAKGELIAVFDADFIPAPDFLARTVHFFTDPQIGMVQMRWGHQNPNDSFLTRLQTVMIDGHFMVDQTARASSNRFFNFNGSAGVWRTKAVLDAGGWQSDTLAEDLDLSYRAQLNGWKFILLTEPSAVQELPRDMRSFKQQQYRWSKGSLEVARKLMWKIITSPVPAKIKIEAFFHLLGNLAYAFVVLSAFISLFFVLFPLNPGALWQYSVDLPLFVICFGSTFLYYFVAQRKLYPNFYARLIYFPLVFASIAGLSLIHVKAIFEVLAGRKTPFVRTPKCGETLTLRTEGPLVKNYRMPLDPIFIFEVLTTCYLVVTVFIAMGRKMYDVAPFLALLALGFLYVTVQSMSRLPLHWRFRWAQRERGQLG